MSQSIDLLVKETLEKKIFSCAEIFLASESKVLYHRVFGSKSPSSQDEPLQKNSIFDLASLTKVLATSLCVMKIIEAGLLTLETPVGKFFDEYQRQEKENINILHLLTHTSGLPAWKDLFSPNWNQEEGWHRLLQTPLENPTATKAVYSCLNFILLSRIIKKITGKELQTICYEEFYELLDLKNTYFSPLKVTERVIPTFSKEEKKWLYGLVQDQNCRLFEGNSGNAGLFSNIQDISVLCRMLLNYGTSQGRKFLEEKTVQAMWNNWLPPKLPARALGWDYYDASNVYYSCGHSLQKGAVGHTGYTGTSLWIEPTKKNIYIILSNRLYVAKNEVEEMKNFRTSIHRELQRLL